MQGMLHSTQTCLLSDGILLADQSSFQLLHYLIRDIPDSIDVSPDQCDVHPAWKERVWAYADSRAFDAPVKFGEVGRNGRFGKPR